MPFKPAFNTLSGVKDNQVSFKMGIWNVRTLNNTQGDLSVLGRADHLVGELQRYGIDICCISEVKWPGSGCEYVRNWRLHFSGSADLRRHGVGILVSPRLKSQLLQIHCLSNRLIVAIFRMGRVKLHLVSVYAPTDDKLEAVKEGFYSSLQSYADSVPVRDKLIIAGDFNAQLGGQDRLAWDGALGQFCLGSRVTDNGTRLLSFCAANHMAVRNTFFQQKSIHLATWAGPAGLHSNQIDHVLVKRRDAWNISRCRVLRGSNFESDHHLLRAECRFPCKWKSKAATLPKMRLNVELLHTHEVKRAFDDQIQASFRGATSEGGQEQWEQFKHAVNYAQSSLLMQPDDKLVKAWLSEQTLQLVDEKKAAWHRVLREKKIAQAPNYHCGEKNEPRPRAKRNEYGPQGGVGSPPVKNEGCEKWCKPTW